MTTADVDSPSCRLESLQTVALSLELMDRREARYVFSRVEDFTHDLALIRKRYTDLADTPPSWDAIRFPGRELLTTCIDANRVYQYWLEERQQLFPGEDWIAEAMEECKRLYCIYDICRDVQTDYYYITVRRAALKQLREKIGPIAYYGGYLPAPVPTWYYRRID